MEQASRTEEVLREYSSLLKQELGEGVTSKILLKGLERILNGQRAQLRNSGLNDSIDYQFMIEIEGVPKPQVTRIRNALSANGINTYGELIESMSDEKDVMKHPRYFRNIHTTSEARIKAHLQRKGYLTN